MFYLKRTRQASEDLDHQTDVRTDLATISFFAVLLLLATERIDGYDLHRGVVGGVG